MILDATTKSIEIDLGEAHTTNALPVTVDYVDLTTTTTTAGSSDTASNGTTAVTIVAAPAASTQRKVNFISVQNADTVSHVTTIQLNNNTTLRSLIVVTLAVGDTLQFTDVGGWVLLDSSGQRKMSMPGYALLNGSASQTFSVATATSAAHAVRADQIQGQSLTAFTTGGTGTAFTLTPTPAITAYTAGQRFNVIFSAACGAAPTLQISGIATPPNLVRRNVDGTYSNLAANAFPSNWKSDCILLSASQVLVEELPKRMITLSATHDMSTATGAKSVTGAGFKARWVRLYAGITNTAAWSIGEYVGAGAAFCVYANRSGTADANEVISNYVGVITESSGNLDTIAFTSFDSDGITFQIAKTGTPTSTIELRIVLGE